MSGRSRRGRRRRPPWWLLAGTALAIAAIVALLVWPSPSAPVTSLRVGEIPAAVRVLEARLGAAPRYIGIDATNDGVSLFVAEAADRQVAWFYRGGTLTGPGAPDATGGLPSFDLQGVALDRANDVARAAHDAFPTATIERFTIRVPSSVGVVWALQLRSSRGGQIAMTFTPAGERLDVTVG